MGLQQSKRNDVKEALIAMCKEQSDKDQAAGIRGLFFHNFSAQAVAERAGCSEGTARRHLDNLSMYRGFSRRRIAGTYGYRYSEEY